MKRKRTISIGGATYDLFVQLASCNTHTIGGAKSFAFPLGEKIAVESVTETCGGGASNTAVGLSRLGCDAKFCGVLADDQWGQTLQRNFQNERVDTRCATIVEDEVSSFSIILSSSGGERTILYNAGANRHLHDAIFSRETLKEVDWVYLNHIQEDSCIIRDDIVDALVSDDAIHFTWNPGGRQINSGIKEEQNAQLLSQTDLLLLNQEEALQFTGQKEASDALRILTDAGARNVCITNGAQGTVASDRKHMYRCPAISNATVADTTGAGDAFGSGATWALVQGNDLPFALRAGTINATSVIGVIGAQAGLLTDIKMQEQMKSTPLDVDVQPL